MFYQFWKSQGIWRRILTLVLSVAIIGTVMAIIYITRQPMVGDRFTDFYVLGTSGRADQYPTELVLGQEGRVILGIINHEQKTMSYKVEMESNGEKVGETEVVTLNNAEKWEHEQKFTLKKAGEKQKVVFLLYREGDTTAYRTLLLWVSVK